MDYTRNYHSIPNDMNRYKMETNSEFGIRKTILVLGVVAICFALLWPKLFSPMLNSSVKPLNPEFQGSVCCDLIFEPDVNAVDILQEMCKNILTHHQVDPRVRDALRTNKLTPQSASFCREEVLSRCGIDLSTFLAEKERVGKSNKQILEEIRSFNGSLCLKNNFGVPLSRLGIPHLIRYHVLMPHTQIKQERRPPSHAGGLHPALRERGQAIPASHVVPKIENRQETTILQNMRPPMGGAGRVVPPQAGSGSMGIIMPLYTFGILIFFIYTIAKIVRKNSNNVIYAEYSHPEAEREFRDRVFNPELLTTAITGMPYYNKESSPIPNKRAPTIDELKQLVDGAPKSYGLAGVPLHVKGECTGKSCCNIDKHEVEDTDDSSPTVLIMGMETTASCEGGQKISRPSTPVISHSPNLIEREPTPPKPIYLEGALPAQCELLVTDSETQAENTQENAEAPVVLSGKMTLSLISLENSADSEDAKGEVHCQEKPEILSETNELEEISRTDVRTDKDVDYNVDSIKIPESRQIEDNEDNINNSKTDKNVHDFDGNIIRDNENEEEEEEEEEDDVDEDNDYQDEEEEVIENKQSGIEDNSEEKLSNTSQ
ncbi:uncharacterized protein RIC-3 isoform X2 [Chelonus insularis]|uniref:uncharacterized protein RIC-3 isoform X2 n=1 Tax=Chelonus insularis TaxID=460826 RepID=UPI00158A434E|nr:uncharacterized protein LOC118066890 isoform X2 [Chelonus insularis]